MDHVNECLHYANAFTSIFNRGLTDEEFDEFIRNIPSDLFSEYVEYFINYPSIRSLVRQIESGDWPDDLIAILNKIAGVPPIVDPSVVFGDDPPEDVKVLTNDGCDALEEDFVRGGPFTSSEVADVIALEESKTFCSGPSTTIMFGARPGDPDRGELIVYSGPDTPLPSGYDKSPSRSPGGSPTPPGVPVSLMAQVGPAVPIFEYSSLPRQTWGTYVGNGIVLFSKDKCALVTYAQTILLGKPGPLPPDMVAFIVPNGTTEFLPCINPTNEIRQIYPRVGMIPAGYEYFVRSSLNRRNKSVSRPGTWTSSVVARSTNYGPIIGRHHENQKEKTHKKIQNNCS